MELADLRPNRMMQELIRLDHRRMQLLDVLFEQDMSRADFGVMDIIYRHREEHPEVPGIYASEIAEKCWVSRPAISRQLQQLENRGWIERTVDPHSKRSAFVFLTDRGREALLRQYERGKNFHNNVFARMGEQQMNELMESMRKLTAAMEQEVQQFKQQGSPKGGCE